LNYIGAEREGKGYQADKEMSTVSRVWFYSILSLDHSLSFGCTSEHGLAGMVVLGWLIVGLHDLRGLFQP